MLNTKSENKEIPPSATSPREITDLVTRITMLETQMLRMNAFMTQLQELLTIKEKTSANVVKLRLTDIGKTVKKRYS